MLDSLFKLPIICFSVLYVQFSPDGHDILAKTTVELARYYMGQVQFTTSVLNCVVILCITGTVGRSCCFSKVII